MQSQSKIDIDFENLRSYPAMPVPYSSRTLDGYLTRTDYAKRFFSLVKDIEAAPLSNLDTTLIIEDCNAFFHYMSAVPKNFLDTCRTAVHLIMVKRSDVICRTDVCKSKLIKGMAHQCRVVIEKFINQGEMTKSRLIGGDTLQMIRTRNG